MLIRQLYVQSVSLIHFILKQKKKKKKNTFTIPCEKSTTVSFTSSIMKNIATLFSKFSVKLISYIAFRSFCCLLKYIAIIL